MTSHKGVNRDLVASLISDIRGAVREARGLVSRPWEELGLYERLALRYLVIELVEASATLCIHLLKKVYGVEVEGYPQCFLRMSELGIIPQGLAERLAKAARLRNLLVHRYWVIDDKRLYRELLTGLRDFEQYADIVKEEVARGEA